MKTISRLIILFFTVAIVSSCEKEIEPLLNYIDLELSGDWQDFAVSDDEIIIFKIPVTTEAQLDISWKDVAAKKEGDTYSADIMVSAYRPDGKTPYFEDLDNGYQDYSQLIDVIEGDDQVLLFVKAFTGKKGSFAIRVRGIYEDVVTNPKDLALSTSYSDKNIATGDTKWLKVDCGSNTNITVEWMEWDRPETGSTYTSDIQVSVYSEDLSTVYVDNKNHGYSTNARAFTVTHGTSIIYIKVSLYDPTKPGTYAIRAFVPAPVK